MFITATICWPASILHLKKYKSNHITPLLKALQWFPISFRSNGFLYKTPKNPCFLLPACLSSLISNCMPP